MDMLELTMSFAAGAAAGAVYLLLLWWTTQRLVRAAHPGGVMLIGAAVRMAVVLGVFLLLSLTGQWQYVAAGLAGFVLARLVVVRRIRTTAQTM